MAIARTLVRLAAQFKPSGAGATAQVEPGAHDSPEVAYTIAQQRVEAQEAVCKLLKETYPRAVAEVEKRTKEHRAAHHQAIEMLAKLKQEANMLYEPVRQDRIASALAASGLPAMEQEPPPPSHTAFPVDAVTAKTMEKVLGLQFGPNGELINASDSSRSASESSPVAAASLPAPVLPPGAESIMRSIGNLSQVPESEVGQAVREICSKIERLPGAEPIVRAFLFSQLVCSARAAVALTPNSSAASNPLAVQIGAAWNTSLGAVQRLSVQLPQHQAAMDQLKSDMTLYIRYHAESQSGI